MNRVVVTGASGFIGSSVVKKLLSEGVEVVALDIAKPSKERLPSNPSLEFYECNIFDINEVIKCCKDYSPDVFYHFAWIGSAGSARSDYNIQIKNALCTVELMKAAKEIGCNRFVVAGTIMEFESFEAIYAQGNKPSPNYIYGTGKQLAHSICKPIANEIGIELIWAYITNAFGVGETSPRLINRTIRKCIDNEVLEFTSGTQLYDFVYIDDVANAFYLLGEKGKENKGYVIGSGHATNLKAFLKTLINICNKDVIYHFGDVPFTGADLPIDYFSIKELQEDCGYRPLVSFEDGIKKTLNWIISLGDNK